MRRPIRWRALAPAALALAFLAAPSAQAALEPGADAPDVSAEEYVNTEPVTLADLAGRVVLLELWKTT